VPLVGNYNPAGFVPGDYSTWPPPPAGQTLYQDGMWWDATGTGQIDGQPIKPGDRIYVEGRAQIFDEETYGLDVFGGTGAGDWPPWRVRFVVWESGLPRDVTFPFPGAGCPFGDDFPGWRFVIDCWLDDLTGARTFGDGQYGTDTYGAALAPVPGWRDITHPSFVVNVGVGTATGSPEVPVSNFTIDLVDDEGEWIDLAVPEVYHLPYVGAPIRVGLLDPSSVYHPTVNGTIERIEDDHDTAPRFITIECFGSDTGIANTVFEWQRPAEHASTRTRALFAAAGWEYEDVLSYPNDSNLLADDSPRQVNARAEWDLIAHSSGLVADLDVWGRPRYRRWPFEPEGNQILVTDCADQGALRSARLRYVADRSQLLNVVGFTNTADVVTQVFDNASVQLFGRASNAFGFPHLNKVYADDIQPVADRILARYSKIITHLEDVQADTHVDKGWLAVLADLDTGRPLRATRTGIRALTLDGIVVGFEHRITPNRWESTIHTSTTTPGL
jgi:hypothetical protein